MSLTTTSPKTKNKTRLTKSTLINEVAARLGTTKVHARRVIEAMVETLIESLEKDVKVTLTGFGSFETRIYKERKGRHPKTGDIITIPKTRRPVFTAGAALKRAIHKE